MPSVYASLNGHASEVRSLADRIRSSLGSVVEEAIDIGRSLLRAKELLAHGQFGEWLHEEFRWSDRTARRYMAIAERFGKSDNVSDLSLSVMVELASSSVPESAVSEVVEKSQRGEVVSVKAAREVVRRHVEPSVKKEPVNRVAKHFDEIEGREATAGAQSERIPIPVSTEQKIMELLATLPVDRQIAVAKAINSQLHQSVPGSLLTDDPADLKPPKKVDTPEVRKAWRMWCSHNEKRKTPITVEQAGLQLKALGNCKPETAVARIEWSIANGEPVIVLAKDIRKDFEAPTLEQALGYGAAMKINEETVRDWFYYFAETGWKKYNSTELIEDWQTSLHRWHRKNVGSDTPPRKVSLREGFVPTPDPGKVERRTRQGSRNGKEELARAAS